MKKIGIIGCGAIGSLIAKSCDNRIIDCDELILYDYSLEKAERLQRSLATATKVARNIDEIIKRNPTVIVEAASQQAVREYLDKILARNIDVIVLSVGALLDLNVINPKIHVPSGAIGGLDAISSVSLAGIDEIVLTTRKNPKILGSDAQQDRIIFEGTAREAVRLFPREMNVAATLALIAGPNKVKVKVISDPKVQRNTHEIKVVWKQGEMCLRFANDPHPENLGTSALAAWSAIDLLRKILNESC